MSWALEAIEKEAMVRAQQRLLREEPRMFGLAPAQVMALIRFFEENIEQPVIKFTPEEISHALHQLVRR